MRSGRLADTLRGIYSAKAQISTVVEAGLRAAGLEGMACVSTQRMPTSSNRAVASMRSQAPELQQLARVHTARILGMAPVSALIATGASPASTMHAMASGDTATMALLKRSDTVETMSSNGGARASTYDTLLPVPS